MPCRPTVGGRDSPSHTLKAIASGGHAWVASASAGPEPHPVTLKLANYASAEQSVAVTLTGWSTALELQRATILTAASPDTENSLEAPKAVVPRPMSIDPPGGTATRQQLTVLLPPWSVVVVTLKVTLQ